MKTFIEFHLIQNFAPSNLNRDGTGAPKDAVFGGVRRARISSQCFKRATRMAAREQGAIASEYGSIRTKKLLRMVQDELPHRDPMEAAGKIEQALNATGLTIVDGNTEYLLFLGEQEIAGFADLVDQYWDILSAPASSDDTKSKKDKKKESKASAPEEVRKAAKLLLDGGKAVDVGLFGRMLANLPEVNQDAACQVAHAISTHRVEREFDYFTAMDDHASAAESGAAMLGTVEFNSSTQYRYAVLDAAQLHSNLHKDTDLTLTAVESFVKATVRAMPSGKQNSFAAHNPPSFVGVCIRHGSPINLANAFEKPVRPSADKALTDGSVAALAAHEGQLASFYADPRDHWAYFDVTGAWPEGKGAAMGNLNELASWVRAQAAQVIAK